MSGKTISNSETKIEALKLQSSAYGVTIPMVFGVCRLAGNLLDYLGFQAVPHTETQGGKGGGVKIQNTSFSYRADVLMGLCHGPITEIPTIWRGKKQYTGGWLPTQINTASETYTPPGSGAMAYTVANAATFLSAVEVRYVETYEGESGTLTIPTVLGQGGRYTVAADGTYTFTDTTLRGQELTIVYQWASGVRAQTAMDQLGLTFKAGTIGQAAWSALPSGRDIGYSGLATVAGQGYDLGTGAQVENHVFEVVGPMAYHLGTSVPDVDPAVMLRAVLTQTQGGAGFPAELLDLWQDWSSYCVAAGVLVSPAMTEQASAADIIRTAAQLTNAAPVWSGGRLKMVPLADEAEAGNGATYTPSSTPAYDLDDESYTPAAAGDSPIRVRHKASAERYNHWRVEFLNRDNQYNPEIAEAKDAADIDESGLRSAEIVKAHWICTPAAARKVAQTMLQRSLYVNSEYTVPLPWHYALIEPADLLTLADTALEMDRLPVRVTVVEENDEGDLTITAEDYPPGTASAAVYPTQAGSGYTANYNADPGNVDTPAIFEAPYTLASTGLEVYAAVRGLTSIWGGYQVWVSLDGTSYKQAGTVYGPSRYGTLADAVLAGDTSLDVEGLGATAQLLSGSAADAAGLQTLCYLGGAAEEYVAHQGATLTGPGAYTLAGLVRAAHGTTAAGHASGAPFVRVDDRIAKSGALDPVLIGSTIYFKFTSFNIWGGGQQQLADADEWPYTITGSQAGLVPRTGAYELRLIPSTMTVSATAAGVVSNWDPAHTEAVVYDADGSVVTDEWGYTLTAQVNVVAGIGGALNNEVDITDFATGVTQSDFRNAVIQLQCYPGTEDTSQFAHTPVGVGAGVTHAAVSPVVGLGYMVIPAGTWSGVWAYAQLAGNPVSGLLFGADESTSSIGRNLVDLTGGPWEMSCFARCPAHVNTTSFSLIGSSVRRIYFQTASGLGVRFSVVWGYVSQATFPEYSSTMVDIGGSSPYVPFNTWAHLKMAYCSDGYLRFWVDGVMVAQALVGTGKRDQLHPDSPYSSKFAVAWSAASSLGGAGPEMHLCQIRHLIGVDNTSAAYTPPTAAFANSPYPSAGRVGVTASKLGETDLTATADLVVLPGPTPTVQAFAVPASLTLPATWQGTVTGNSLTATLKVLVGGVDAAGWSMAVTRDLVSSVTATQSGKTITATGMDAGRSSGELRVWLTHASYPPQYVVIPVGKSFASQPVQTNSITPSITLAGDTSGHVASYTGASGAAKRFESGVDQSSTYGWTITASAGITVSNTGNGGFAVTAIGDGVDSGTITVASAKSNWTPMTAYCAVFKTRSLTPSGAVIATMRPITAIQGASGGFAVSVRINPNGTREVDRGAGWEDAGNWYNPTTTDIGASYYARMPSPNLPGYASYCTGSYGVWQSLSTARTFVVGDDSQPVGGVEVSGQMIVSASSTGADGGLGLGLVTLIATKEGS